MKILSIGNSFSEDAHRYLRGLADASGIELEVSNLVIAGCSLERHHAHIENDVCDYIYEENGENTHRLITLREGLSLHEWDIITLQQVSKLSFDEESFFPYVTELRDYVKSFAPNAKIYLHQTWSYADEEKLGAFGFKTHGEMFYKIERTYKSVKARMSADGIIPAGEVVERLKNRGFNLHRDWLHLSRALGRYAAGLVWLGSSAGVDPRTVESKEFDADITKEEIRAAAECAYETLSSGENYYYQDI